MMITYYAPRPWAGRLLDPWTGTTAAAAAPVVTGVVDAEGTALESPEDCGFVFQGYAVPIYDPQANLDADPAGCLEGWATEWIGWHVNTASTCTIRLSSGQYRMYLPEPRLAKDDDDEIKGVNYPFSHPADPHPETEGGAYARYPDDAVWGQQSSFSPDYIAFVDSTDGRSFPVYAPVMGRFGDECDDWDVNGWSDAPDWSNAGWTPTCIPSRTDPDAPAGATDASGTFVYSVYRDPSVVYVPSKGKYLMFAVECRSSVVYDGDDLGQANPCTPQPDPKNPKLSILPFTRYVVFISDSPDFEASGTSPSPVNADELMVLATPYLGADGPTSGEVASEWYAVPHTIMSPDGQKVLVYLGWAGSDLHLPTRIVEFYGGTQLPWSPVDARPGSGVSVFAIDAAALVDALVAGDHAGLDGLVAASYQGEALFTDNTRDEDGDLQVLWYNDQQFLACEGEVWCYHAAPADCTYQNDAGVDAQNQLRRLQHVPIAELPDDLAALFGGTPQGDYTIFMAPSSCWTVYDLTGVIPDSTGGATRDPDVAVLADGSIRVTSIYSGAGAGTEGQGLIQVIADPGHSLCVSEDFTTPDEPEEPEEPEEPYEPDCEALCNSDSFRDSLLCELYCGETDPVLAACERRCTDPAPSDLLWCQVHCGGGTGVDLCARRCTDPAPSDLFWCQVHCGGGTGVDLCAIRCAQTDLRSVLWCQQNCGGLEFPFGHPGQAPGYGGAGIGNTNWREPYGI